jgi:hypothetical protein
MPKALWLCLFVLLTPADDAWARASPDDDALAAANNDYTPPAPDDAAPVAPRTAPPALLPGVTGRRGPAAALAPPGSPGPHPLCLLMSLLY